MCVIARLAQSAERKALNLVVVGLSPTVGVFWPVARLHSMHRSCEGGRVKSWDSNFEPDSVMRVEDLRCRGACGLHRTLQLERGCS